MNTSGNKQSLQSVTAKVPAATLGFWIVKVQATTLGETAGDTVSMSWLGETTSAATGWGYLIGTAIFLVPLGLLIIAQIRARGFNPFLYWATIIASTTAGTTLADFFTRTLFTRTWHVDQATSYLFASLALMASVAATLLMWRRMFGTVSIESLTNPRAELFYWITVTLSQTLGTALGDWTVDGFGDAMFMGMESGYVLGAFVFLSMLGVVALLSRVTSISPAGLFWAAFVLTRPLGATLGDFLDKPIAKGGLDFSRPIATAALLIGIALSLWLLPDKPAAARVGRG